MRFLAAILGSIAAVLALPAIAHAQVGVLTNVVDAVISGTPLTTNLTMPKILCPTASGTGPGVGACQLAALFLYVVARMRILVGLVAFAMIVIAGFNLIVRQSEESMGAARKTIVGVVVGVFLIFLSEQFVDAIYGGFSIDPGTVLADPINLEAGAYIISNELMGIVRWAETLVAITAIGLMVAQAIVVLSSFGAEETIRKAYRSVFYTVIGLLLIVFDRTIAAIFGYSQLAAFPGAPDATIFVVEVFGFIRFLLGFVAIAAIGVVIYAGILMIAHFGQEEMVTKARTIIINGVIGLVLIVVSFVVVQTVILGIT